MLVGGFDRGLWLAAFMRNHGKHGKSRKWMSGKNSPSGTAFVGRDEIHSCNVCLFFPSVTFRTTDVSSLRATRRCPQKRRPDSRPPRSKGLCIFWFREFAKTSSVFIFLPLSFCLAALPAEEEGDRKREAERLLSLTFPRRRGREDKKRIRRSLLPTTHYPPSTTHHPLL